VPPREGGCASVSGVRPVQGVLDCVIQIRKQIGEVVLITIQIILNPIIHLIFDLQFHQVGVRDRHGVVCG